MKTKKIKKEKLKKEWRKNESGRFKTKLNSFLKPDIKDIPDIILSNIRLFYIIGIIMIGVSFVFALVFSSWKILPFGIFTGIMIAGYGHITKLLILKEGYETMKCECIKIVYSIVGNVNGDKMPKRFIIKDIESGKKYNLQYFKNNIELQEGNIILVYRPKGSVDGIEINGVSNIGAVYAYELYS